MSATRLTRFVALPGGVDAATALDQATANAEAYRATALTLIDQAIEQLITAGQDASPETVARLAESVGSMAGMFDLATLGQAAKRLSGLVRALHEKDAWDRTSVWIHVQALKVIRQHGDSETLGEMLEGLRRLAARASGPT